MKVYEIIIYIFLTSLTKKKLVIPDLHGFYCVIVHVDVYVI